MAEGAQTNKINYAVDRSAVIVCSRDTLKLSQENGIPEIADFVDKLLTGEWGNRVSLKEIDPPRTTILSGSQLIDSTDFGN